MSIDCQTHRNSPLPSNNPITLFMRSSVRHTKCSSFMKLFKSTMRRTNKIEMGFWPLVTAVVLVIAFVYGRYAILKQRGIRTKSHSKRVRIDLKFSMLWIQLCVSSFHEIICGISLNFFATQYIKHKPTG